jgi:hypothetical protein
MIWDIDQTKPVLRMSCPSKVSLLGWVYASQDINKCSGVSGQKPSLRMSCPSKVSLLGWVKASQLRMAASAAWIYGIIKFFSMMLQVTMTRNTLDPVYYRLIFNVWIENGPVL